MGKKACIGFIVVAIAALLVIPAGAFAGGPKGAAVKNPGSLSDSEINGYWLGTYTSDLGVTFDMEWIIRDDKLTTIMSDQQESFIMRLDDCEISHLPGSTDVDAVSLLGIHAYGQTVELESVYDCELVSPNRIVGPVNQYLTYSIFIHFFVEHGTVDLHKMSCAPPQLSVSQIILGHYEGGAESDVSPGEYSLRFDCVEEGDDYLLLNNVRLRQTCGCTDHDILTALFSSTQADLSAPNGVTMTITLLLPSSVFGVLIPVDITMIGTMDDLSMSGTYTIMSSGLGMTFDWGSWAVNKASQPNPIQEHVPYGTEK